MDLSIASILMLDGVTNGAIYALLALAIVLVFAVTRVIFIPQGEFVAYGALTLAMLQLGQVPGTVWLLLGMALVAAVLDAAQSLRRGISLGQVLRDAALALVFPLAVCAIAWWAAPRQWPLLIQSLLTLAIVTPLGPLVYRLAYQRLADATVLVLLIVSVGTHFALTGLGLVFFGAEGFRNPSFWDCALQRRGGQPDRADDHHLRGLDRADPGAVPVLRAHAAGQGVAGHGGEPPGRAADGHLHRRAPAG